MAREGPKVRTSVKPAALCTLTGSALALAGPHRPRRRRHGPGGQRRHPAVTALGRGRYGGRRSGAVACGAVRADQADQQTGESSTQGRASLGKAVPTSGFAALLLLLALTAALTR